MPESDDRDPIIALIDSIGVDAAAQRYVVHMSGVHDANLDLMDAFWSGDGASRLLPLELRWNLLLAAIHQCPDDDELLWRLGDGPVDNNAVDPEIRRRVFAARATDAKVQRLFEAMRRQLPIKDRITDGAWYT